MRVTHWKCTYCGMQLPQDPHLCPTCGTLDVGVAREKMLAMVDRPGTETEHPTLADELRNLRGSVVSVVHGFHSLVDKISTDGPGVPATPDRSELQDLVIGMQEIARRVEDGITDFVQAQGSEADRAALRAGLTAGLTQFMMEGAANNWADPLFRLSCQVWMIATDATRKHQVKES